MNHVFIILTQFPSAQNKQSDPRAGQTRASVCFTCGVAPVPRTAGAAASSRAAPSLSWSCQSNTPHAQTPNTRRTPRYALTRKPHQHCHAKDVCVCVLIDVPLNGFDARHTHTNSGEDEAVMSLQSRDLLLLHKQSVKIRSSSQSHAQVWTHTTRL